LRNLSCERIQADEIWRFVHAKQRNVPQEKRGQFGYGDVWTWTALDADRKLIVAWYVGRRDARAAYEFMSDVADRLTNRVQLTMDGHAAYLSAVDAAFSRGPGVDYAQLVKIYGMIQRQTQCPGIKIRIREPHPSDNRHHRAPEEQRHA